MQFETCQTLCSQARELSAAGDQATAIERYRDILQSFTEAEEAAKIQPDLRNLVMQAANEFVDLLRWEKRYKEAIDVQRELVEFFPEAEAAERAGLANLKIEAGHAKEGLQELRDIAEQDPDNPWSWITLGSGYLWVEQFDEAEEYLLRAATMKTAPNEDRATAYRYLFGLFDVRGRHPEAAYVWDLGRKLAPKAGASRSELYRMLIYWRQYDETLQRLEHDTYNPRRFYYQGLVAFKRNMMTEAIELWNKVVEFRHERLREGHEEFVEACIRFLRPQLALEVLEPLIEGGHSGRNLLLLAGLAWAQRRIVNRSTWALDIALQMADLERPRRTRPAGEGRVFDARARILYGEVTIDKDIRERLDRYFIPKKAKAAQAASSLENTSAPTA